MIRAKEEIERDLTSAQYLSAHEAFRASTNQAQQICDWFERNGLLELGGVVPGVLSVGAGGGEIDYALIERLGSRGTFSYDAIDRSRPALERFSERCGGLERQLAQRVWLYNGDFHQFEPGQRYDLVHFCHALYSIGNLQKTLGKAYRLVGDGGALALICSTDDGVNAFRREVYRQVDLPGRTGSVPEGELVDALCGLERAGQEYDLISGEVVVDACFDKSEHGASVLNFFLQANSSTLDRGEKRRVLRILESHCVAKDGRRVLPLPMLAVIVRKSKPATIRRVSLKVGGKRHEAVLPA